MSNLSSRRQQRRGAAVVEMAAVAIIFLLFLFGILEYCRFIFINQVVENAAREGARYAVVNTQSATLDADTQALVTQRLAGTNNAVSGFTVVLYNANASGTNIGAASNAQFGQYIAVQVDCDYRPVLPNFLRMGNTLHIRSKCMMYSEAN